MKITVISGIIGALIGGLIGCLFGPGWWETGLVFGLLIGAWIDENNNP